MQNSRCVLCRITDRARGDISDTIRFSGPWSIASHNQSEDSTLEVDRTDEAALWTIHVVFGGHSGPETNLNSLHSVVSSSLGVLYSSSITV